MTFETDFASLSDACDAVDGVYEQFSKSSGTRDHLQTLADGLTGDRAQGSRSGAALFRRACAGAVVPEIVGGLLEPIFRQMGETIESPEPDGDIDRVWEDIYDYCADTSPPYHVKSRGFTFGTPSAGASNVGNGEVVRLTTDENGWPLEGHFADNYTLECLEDGRQLGETGQEVFEIRGEAATQDGLELTGTGLLETLVSLDSRGSTGLVSNPSFDEMTVTGLAAGTPATPTAVSGWTDETDGDFSNTQADIDAADYYIASPNAPRNTGLRLQANKTISQDLVSVAGARFDPGAPYVFGFAMKRESSATGTMTFTVGSVSRAITIGSQTDDDWTWFWLVATPAANNWFDSFNQNTLKMSFALTSLATGTVIIDHVVASRMTRVGSFSDPRVGRGAMGTWIAIRSGTTPWVRGDSFTWTDSATGREKIPFWLAWMGRGYLPAVDDATQVTAAGGRTLTFADDNPDTITASSGDFTSDGFQAGMTLTVAGTSNNNGTFTISGVTATVITLISTDTLTAEGPLSATATLDATARIQ
jgi:hypothetical protein